MVVRRHCTGEVILVISQMPATSTRAFLSLLFIISKRALYLKRVCPIVAFVPNLLHLLAVVLSAPLPKLQCLQLKKGWPHTQALTHRPGVGRFTHWQPALGIIALIRSFFQSNPCIHRLLIVLTTRDASLNGRTWHRMASLAHISPD